MRGFNFNSLKAIPQFFAYRNEIDIYTEDKKTDKEFYKALLTRLVNGKVKINDITPLGCKANVLKAYDEQSKTSNRKKVFIVDGDLELIIGTNRKSENNLVVLDSYCIENYIIDEKASLELIYYSVGNADRASLGKKLNFDKWLQYNLECLITLFLNLALLRMYGGGPVLKSASQFIKTDKKQQILNTAEVEKYSNRIKEEIIQLLSSQDDSTAEKTYSEDFSDLKKKWKLDTDTMLRIVSGKDYLIQLLQHRIKFAIGKGNSMFPKQSLKLFLANHCKLERLGFLKKQLK